MNTLQSIESIQQVFPNVSRNQIRLDLDVAQKLLASETGTLTTIASLSDPTTNTAWNLPSNFVGLEDVSFYDSNNNPIYIEDLNYKYEIEFNKIYIYSLTSTPITGLDVSSAYIHYKSISSTLVDDTTDMEVAESFRDAIESYVLGKYFAKFPIDVVVGNQIAKVLNIQAAQLHKNEYEKLRIKLKKYFGSRIKTSGEAIYYPHAGSFYLPKRTYSSGTGSIITPTVTLSGLNNLYTKYAYYRFISTDTTKDPILSIGYSNISASVTGTNEITVTSSSEFDEETIILPNNWDASWIRNSSSEIVFTLPSGWTTFSFEIYERD